jgi:6-phosphogluconolactonase
MQSIKWMILVPTAWIVFLAGCAGTPCNGPEVFEGGANKNGFVCNGTGGGTPGGPIAPVFVYTTDNTETVHAASLTNGTTFAELTGLPLPTLPMQTLDMLVVSKKFLYIAGVSGSNGEVFGYTINSTTGGLTAIAGNPVLTGTPAAFSMTTDPQGRFLFVGDAAGQVAAFQINSTTGGLTAAPNSPFLLDPTTGLGVSLNLTVDNTGNFLYVGQGPGARASLIFDVFGFNIDQNSGALTPIIGEPFALGIGPMQANPLLPYVLATSDTTGDNQIYAVTVGSGTGTLAPIISTPTLNAPHQVFVHPSGKFVYTIEDGQSASDVVEGFSIDANGNVALLSNSPTTATDNLVSCKFDQNGNWAFCPTFGSKIAVFGVNTSSGALNSPIPSLVIGSGSAIAVTD